MSLCSKIFSVLILCPLFCFSQSEISLDNNLTGIYSKNKSIQQFGLNFVGNNSFQKNHFILDGGTNYSLRYSPSISENEFIQRLNIGYIKENHDLFTTYQFNYSFVRGILSDNWIGLGGGIKRKFKSVKFSLSYATIYEKVIYRTSASDVIFRHSIRGKMKIEKNLFGFSTEYFYQPSISKMSDYIIYGTSKISIFENKPFSLIIQDVINYRNKSDVQMIHNISIGCSYKFSDKIK